MAWSIRIILILFPIYSMLQTTTWIIQTIFCCKDCRKCELKTNYSMFNSNLDSGKI